MSDINDINILSGRDGFQYCDMEWCLRFKVHTGVALLETILYVLLRFQVYVELIHDNMSALIIKRFSELLICMRYLL